MNSRSALSTKRRMEADRENNQLYYFDMTGNRLLGTNSQVKGDSSKIYGDSSWIISGDISGLSGYCTDVWIEDATGIEFNLDEILLNKRPCKLLVVSGKIVSQLIQD